MKRKLKKAGKLMLILLLAALLTSCGNSENGAESVNQEETEAGETSADEEKTDEVSADEAGENSGASETMEETKAERPPQTRRLRRRKERMPLRNQKGPLCIRLPL